jgi:hypothetical protein
MGSYEFHGKAGLPFSISECQHQIDLKLHVKEVQKRNDLQIHSKEGMLM